MRGVEIFDPPMCCPTGICGPTVDPVLLDVQEMIQQLKEDGIPVQRYAINTNPNAFLENPEVARLIQERKMAALPITVVNGVVIKTGSYPSLAEIRSALSKG